MLQIKDDNDRKLIAAGAVLLLTSDGGIQGPTQKATANPFFDKRISAPESSVRFGVAHINWIKAAIEHGMTPMNALLSATSHTAKAYKRNDIGTLEVGKRADLLVLSADPLADPDNYAKLVDVYKDGARVNRDALPTKTILSQ
jgi:predicted amidohydrolase YtcJ